MYATIFHWLSQLSAWLERTQMNHAIQAHDWIVPIVQSIHILGIAPPRGRRNARERLDAALGGHHLRRPLDRLLLLVSRFRSSQTPCGTSDANSVKGDEQIYDSLVWFCISYARLRLQW
jgi:hypothetical protein